jgi:hypothetical protein
MASSRHSKRCSCGCWEPSKLHACRGKRRVRFPVGRRSDSRVCRRAGYPRVGTLLVGPTEKEGGHGEVSAQAIVSGFWRSDGASRLSGRCISSI